MDKVDLKISQRLRTIITKLERIVKQETGEELGIGLVVFPFTRPGEPSRQAECQYISNCPREHMHGALKSLVKKWDGGMPDVPPHEKQ